MDETRSPGLNSLALKAKRELLLEIRKEAKFYCPDTPCTAVEIARAFDAAWDKYRPEGV